MADYLIVPNSENAIPDATEIISNGIEIFHSTSYTRYAIAPKLNTLSNSHLNEYIGKIGYSRSGTRQYSVTYGVLKNDISNLSPILYYTDSDNITLHNVTLALDTQTGIYLYTFGISNTYTLPSNVTIFDNTAQVLNAMNDGIWTIQPEHVRAPELIIF